MKEKKAPWKEIIDILMLLLLFNQMVYVLMEQRIHEWTGTCLVTLAFSHNILNRKWYQSMGKGNYLRFLPIHKGRAMARKVHIACAYWGFLLMAAHFGMHWNAIWGKLKKRLPFFLEERNVKILKVGAGMLALYGIYAVGRHEILSFLFLKNEFAIFNPDWPVFLVVYLVRGL